MTALPRCDGKASEVLSEQEGGFGVVEVMVASLILVIVLVSFSNMVIDSLTTALTARQREAAASLASDVVENARALGWNELLMATTASCASSPNASPVRVILVANIGCFTSSYTTSPDSTAFIVSPSLPPTWMTAVPYSAGQVVAYNPPGPPAGSTPGFYTALTGSTGSPPGLVAGQWSETAAIVGVVVTWPGGRYSTSSGVGS
jgi:hypothetical protein